MNNKHQGARQQKTRSSDRLRGYLKNHRLVAKSSLQRLLQTPLSSLMAWLVIGIALALPASLYVGMDNLQSATSNWGGQAQISLFLHPASSEPDNRALARQLQLHQAIESVHYISPEQALAEFQRQSGFGNVLNKLDRNPLPAVLVVKPLQQDKQAVEKLFQELQAMPKINQALLDQEWIQRLQSILALGQRLSAILGALLATGVLLVVGNTIRLTIESRRDEITIIKLVGGTDAFVRRPFLYTGFWYGLGGGLVAWLIILLGLWALAEPAARLTGLYSSSFQLQGLGFGNTLLLWLGSALLGLLGAWLAVSRHLKHVRPT